MYLSCLINFLLSVIIIVWRLQRLGNIQNVMWTCYMADKKVVKINIIDSKSLNVLSDWQTHFNQ